MMIFLDITLTTGQNWWEIEMKFVLMINLSNDLLENLSNLEGLLLHLAGTFCVTHYVLFINDLCVVCFKP